MAISAAVVGSLRAAHVPVRTPWGAPGWAGLAFERERHPLAPKAAEETDLTKLAKLRAEDDALLQRLLGPVEEDAVEPSAGGALADARDDKDEVGAASASNGDDLARRTHDARGRTRRRRPAARRARDRRR